MCFPQLFYKINISKSVKTQKHKSSNHFTKSGLGSRGGAGEAESGTAGHAGRDESKVALGSETWGGEETGHWEETGATRRDQGGGGGVSSAAERKPGR
jgi:hypothetical protein